MTLSEPPDCGVDEQFMKQKYTNERREELGIE
jgi:hypothetical protein